MKKYLLLLAMTGVLATARAQTTDTVKGPPLPANGGDPDGNLKSITIDEPVFTLAPNPPAFPGGTDSLHRYLSRHIVYPPALLQAHKGGKVVVSFVVEKDGSLSGLQVQLSPGEQFSAEALKAIKPLRFKPGSQNGHAVRVMYNVVLRFDPDYPGIF